MSPIRYPYDVSAWRRCYSRGAVALPRCFKLYASIRYPKRRDTHYFVLVASCVNGQVGMYTALKIAGNVLTIGHSPARANMPTLFPNVYVVRKHRQRAIGTEPTGSRVKYHKRVLPLHGLNGA